MPDGADAREQMIMRWVCSSA